MIDGISTKSSLFYPVRAFQVAMAVMARYPRIPGCGYTHHGPLGDGNRRRWHVYSISLAKHTTSGDLLDEVRRGCNDTSSPVTTWQQLRGRILELFLSASESLKLQAMLETTTQQNGEAISTYVRRFRPEAQRAYSQQREASEEFRVVSGFLRGFRDRHFAARIFRKGRIGTLAEATTSALELEAEREKMEQMLTMSG